MGMTVQTDARELLSRPSEKQVYPIAKVRHIWSKEKYILSSPSVCLLSSGSHCILMLPGDGLWIFQFSGI